jgi:hypothetical protein
MIMSKQPEKLKKRTEKNNSITSHEKMIKSIYAFEFLGLNTKEVIEENDLESALLLASHANATKMPLLRSWQNFRMKMRKKMRMNTLLSPYPFITF